MICKECSANLIFICERDKTRKKFCSRKCRSRFYGKQRNRFAKKTQKECPVCNKNFLSKFARNIYCSSARQKQVVTKKYWEKEHTLEEFLGKLANRKSPKVDRSELSAEFLVDLFNKQKGRCALSGAFMTHITRNGHKHTNISIDRVDSNVGYLKHNVQLVCFIVNLMKREMSTSEFVEWCGAIVENKNAIPE